MKSSSEWSPLLYYLWWTYWRDFDIRAVILGCLERQIFRIWYCIVEGTAWTPLRDKIYPTLGWPAYGGRRFEAGTLFFVNLLKGKAREIDTPPSAEAFYWLRLETYHCCFVPLEGPTQTMFYWIVKQVWVHLHVRVVEAIRTWWT